MATTYAVQVFVNRKYSTVSTTTDLSVAYDRFTAFNRTGIEKGKVTGDLYTHTDAATRLVKLSDTGKATVLRKGRTAKAVDPNAIPGVKKLSGKQLAQFINLRRGGLKVKVGA